MKQLERAGFGKFSKVEKSNTLTLDVEAITSGKAVVAEKKPKLKAEKEPKPRAEEKREKAEEKPPLELVKEEP